MQQLPYKKAIFQRKVDNARSESINMKAGYFVRRGISAALFVEWDERCGGQDTLIYLL